MESSLRACLAEAASTTRWCDVHVRCGGRLFKAHRVVLSSVSPFLRILLLSRSEEDIPSTIVLPDFTEKAMSAVMSYIYNGEVLIPNTILIEFLNIINALQISIDKRYFDYLREQIRADQKYTSRIDESTADEIKNSCYINTAGTHDYGAKEQHSNHMDIEALIKSDRISKKFSPTIYSAEEPYHVCEGGVNSDTIDNPSKNMYQACSERRQDDEEQKNVCVARDSDKECLLRDVDTEICLANCVPTIANDTNLCSTSLDEGIEASTANFSDLDIRHTFTKSYAVCGDARDMNANLQNTEITLSLQSSDVACKNNISKSTENRDNEGGYSSSNQIKIHSKSNEYIQCHSVESSVNQIAVTENNDIRFRNKTPFLGRVRDKDLFTDTQYIFRTDSLPLKPISYRFDKSIFEQNDSRLKEGTILRPVPSLLPITSKMNFIHTRHEGFRKIPDLLDLSVPRNMTAHHQDVTDNFRGTQYNMTALKPSCLYSGSNGFSRNSDPYYGLVPQSNVTSSFPAFRSAKRSAHNKVLASPWCTRGPICYRRNQTIRPAPDIYPYTSVENLTYETASELEKHHFIDESNIKVKTNEALRVDSISNDSNNNLTAFDMEEESNESRSNCLPRLERLTSTESISNKGFSEVLKDGHTTSVSDGKFKNPHSIDKIMMGTAKTRLDVMEENDNCAMKCEICSKMFTSKATMAAHVKSHSSQGRYHCDQCDKSFSQLRNYKYHVSVHKGTKEFAATCNVCGKYFNDRGYLSSHMKIHRNRKEYQCPHCPKSFNQRVAYNMHVRIHTGVKPHVCESCGKAFSRKMLLKQHQRTHSGEKPYACAACGKRFADRSNMTLHARLHSGVKPFSCTMCPKSFTKKHHLKTHLNYHTGNKPYACERCGIAFSQSSNMRTHMKKCVPKVRNENISIDNLMVS